MDSLAPIEAVDLTEQFKPRWTDPVRCPWGHLRADCEVKYKSGNRVCRIRKNEQKRAFRARQKADGVPYKRRDRRTKPPVFRRSGNQGGFILACGHHTRQYWVGIEEWSKLYCGYHGEWYRIHKMYNLTQPHKTHQVGDLYYWAENPGSTPPLKPAQIEQNNMAKHNKGPLPLNKLRGRKL